MHRTVKILAGAALLSWVSLSPAAASHGQFDFDVMCWTAAESLKVGAEMSNDQDGAAKMTAARDRILDRAISDGAAIRLSENKVRQRVVSYARRRGMNGVSNAESDRCYRAGMF